MVREMSKRSLITSADIIVRMVLNITLIVYIICRQLGIAILYGDKSTIYYNIILIILS